jgi:hypothetical protein
VPPRGLVGLKVEWFQTLKRNDRHLGGWWLRFLKLSIWSHRPGERTDTRAGTVDHRNRGGLVAPPVAHPAELVSVSSHDRSAKGLSTASWQFLRDTRNKIWRAANLMLKRYYGRCCGVRFALLEAVSARLRRHLL